MAIVVTVVAVAVSIMMRDILQIVTQSALILQTASAGTGSCAIQVCSVLWVVVTGDAASAADILAKVEP
jgi:hypothetical protein